MPARPGRIAALDNGRVLLHDETLTGITDALPVLEQVSRAGRSLPIVAEGHKRQAPAAQNDPGWIERFQIGKEQNTLIDGARDASRLDARANRPDSRDPSRHMMVYSDSIASLKTRSEVRGFLATRLNDLFGGKAQQDLPEELSGLATGSDREVIESCRRLDKSYDPRNTGEGKHPRTAMSRQVQELFALALQRMKELPPDPRETLHVQAPASADGVKSEQKRRARR